MAHRSEGMVTDSEVTGCQRSGVASGGMVRLGGTKMRIWGNKVGLEAFDSTCYVHIVAPLTMGMLVESGANEHAISGRGCVEEVSGHRMPTPRLRVGMEVQQEISKW